MKNTAPSAFKPSPFVAVALTLLPAVLSFAPLFMAMASADTVSIAAAVVLAFGLDGLFYMMVRQQKQLQELQAQLAQIGSQESA